METIIGILLIALLLGLVMRERGDGLLDTLSAGCSSMWGCLILVIILLVVIGLASFTYS
jgi:hypothetical protein